jgi:hypothetical protein
LEMGNVKIKKRRCLVNEFLAAGPRLIEHITSRLPYRYVSRQAPHIRNYEHAFSD